MYENNKLSLKQLELLDIVHSYVVPQSVNFVKNNFLFFAACPDHFFKEIARHPVAKYIKTLREIYIAFIPTESQVLLHICFFDLTT